MFIVRSTRAQGAAVEVLRKGKKLVQRISGMGSTTSDGYTADLKLQEDFKWITMTKIGKQSDLGREDDATRPGLESAMIAADERKRIDTTPPLELDDGDDDDSSEVLASQYYSDKEIKKIKKDDLIELIELHGLDIDPTQRVGGLRAALMQLEIPKE